MVMTLRSHRNPHGLICLIGILKFIDAYTASVRDIFVVFDFRVLCDGQLTLNPNDDSLFGLLDSDSLGFSL